MSSDSADYWAAIEALPAAAMLVVQGVPWANYERLLENLTDRPGVRVSYDRGRLEIVSPLTDHEEYNRFTERLMAAFRRWLRKRIREH